MLNIFFLDFGLILIFPNDSTAIYIYSRREQKEKRKGKKFEKKIKI